MLGKAFTAGFILQKAHSVWEPDTRLYPDLDTQLSLVMGRQCLSVGQHSYCLGGVVCKASYQ